MTAAGQLIMVSGDAPELVPTGRKTFFLDAAGRLCLQGPDGIVQTLRVVGGEPAAYSRSAKWLAGDSNVAPSRTSLIPPAESDIRIGEGGFRIAAPKNEIAVIDLNTTDVWNGLDVVGNYNLPATRAGKDIYIYAVNDGNTARYVLSPLSTYPIGYSYTSSRKVGGLHCLCADVGVISGHPLSGYVAGDILPASVWDIKFRPASSPEGMVYSDGVAKWFDIYLSSVSGGKLVSVKGGIIADGASAVSFHYYKFCQWLGSIGKRPPTQLEFLAASLGANQGTEINGSADPNTTGGHMDTAGRRMVSNIGCEDTCGVMWQWGIESGGGNGTADWKAAFDANDDNVGGQSFQEPNRALLGGYWSSGMSCGSRGSIWACGPLFLSSNLAARGVAEPLAAGL